MSAPDEGLPEQAVPVDTLRGQDSFCGKQVKSLSAAVKESGDSMRTAIGDSRTDAFFERFHHIFWHFPVSSKATTDRSLLVVQIFQSYGLL